MKKYVLKTLAIVSAAALIFLVFFIANMFAGNPITKLDAKNKAEAYMINRYQNPNLQIEQVNYDFVYNMYSVLCIDTINNNMEFHAYYNDGKIYRDDYYTALSTQNIRTNKTALKALEYSEPYILHTLQNKFSNTFSSANYVPVEILPETFNGENSDTIFKREIAPKIEIILYFDEYNTDSIYLSEILKDTYNYLANDDYFFNKYTIICSNDDNFFIVSSVIPEQIQNNNLIELIDTAKEKYTKNGIIIYDSKV